MPDVVGSYDLITGQIDDYGLLKDDNIESYVLAPNAQRLLNPEVLEKLHCLEQQSSEKRKKYLNHISEILKNLSNADLKANKDRLQNALDTNDFSNTTVSLKEILGENGIKLLQEALEEETQSDAYREAVFHKSTYIFKTQNDNAKNLDLIVAGPSSSGKTYASISKAAELLGATEIKYSDIDDDNIRYMVSCDGGIVREVSQVRKAVIQLAYKLGYSEITDLHKETKKYLDPIKDTIKQAAQLADCGLIIPETFSEWPLEEAKSNNRYKKEIDSLLTRENEKNTKLHFLSIQEQSSADDFLFADMAQTIKISGKKRSRIKNIINAQTIDLNISGDAIGESKIYSAGKLTQRGLNYDAGVWGSKLAGEYYTNKSARKVIKINYALILVKKDPKNPDNIIRVTASDESAYTIARRTYYAWEEYKKRTVPEKRLAFDDFKKNESAIKNYTPKQEFSLIPLSKEERTAFQVHYMNYIKEKALKKTENRHYDLQGRLMCEIELDDNDYREILLSMSAKSQNLQSAFHKIQNHYDFNPDYLFIFKPAIDGALGFRSKETTLISIDLNIKQDANFINPLKEFSDEFYKRLKNILDSNNNTEKSIESPKIQEIVDIYKKLPKGSIIPLHKEYYYHLKGSLRTMRNVLASMHPDRIELSDTQLQYILNKTFEDVTKDIDKKFANILIEVYKNNERTLPVSEINKLLDKARKELLQVAHDLLYENIIENLEPDNQSLEYQKLIQKHLKKHAKHIAETTPASEGDILEIVNNGPAQLIQNSQYTSHFRVKGPCVASRQIVTHFTNSAGEIIPNNKKSRLQIRTPSLAIKEHSRKKVRVADVAEKLEHLKEEYALDQRDEYKTKEHENGLPNIFTYNLHTSLSKGFFPKGDQISDAFKFLTKFNSWFSGKETGRNLQTQSADDILRGAHLYNRDTYKNLKDTHTTNKPIFCLVQNIPTNTKGSTLSNNRQIIIRYLRYAGISIYNINNWLKKISTNVIIRTLLFIPRVLLNVPLFFISPERQIMQLTLDEATLMAEMSLVNTILHGEYRNGTLQEKHIKKLMAQYEQYLEEIQNHAEVPANMVYFSETKFGKEAKKIIDQIKHSYRTFSIRNIDENNQYEFNTLLKNSLQILVGHNMHQNHDYARLIQSMSVYLSNISISGCKSANERAQAINGRVLVDDIFANEDILKANDDYDAMDIKNVKVALEAFASSNSINKNNIKQKALKLKEDLDTFFNKYALQLGPAAISYCDQGGPAKVGTRPAFYNPFVAYFDSNNVEELGLSNLETDNAFHLQAHKGMTKAMNKACEKSCKHLSALEERENASINDSSSSRSSYESISSNFEGSVRNDGDSPRDGLLPPDARRSDEQPSRGRFFSSTRHSSRSATSDTEQSREPNPGNRQSF